MKTALSNVWQTRAGAAIVLHADSCSFPGMSCFLCQQARNSYNMPCSTAHLTLETKSNLETFTDAMSVRGGQSLSPPYHHDAS